MANNEIENFFDVYNYLCPGDRVFYKTQPANKKSRLK